MKIGNVELKNNVILAPMAGITDMAFRKICKKFGAGLVVTEMVSSKGMFYNDEKTNLLTAIDEEERPVAVQIFGSDPDIMAKSAEKISEYADIIDINMGCPAPKVVKNDDGSKLMLNLELVDKITKKVVEASKVPVTVKTRKGWDDAHVTAVDIAEICEQNGVSAIAVHGRTRDQFYSGVADWDIISKVKQAVKIPVIGNGDVIDLESAKRLVEQTNCDGIMIGRGAIGNPWIFKSVIEGIEYKPSKEEIIDIILEHYDNLCELKSEYVAVREMRKHISYYIKGMPNATEIRRKINEITDKEEAIKVIKGL